MKGFYGNFSGNPGRGQPPYGGDLHPVSALVDTGATYSMMLGSLMSGLRMSPSEPGRFRMADGAALITAWDRRDSASTAGTRLYRHLWWGRQLFAGGHDPGRIWYDGWPQAAEAAPDSRCGTTAITRLAPHQTERRRGYPPRRRFIILPCRRSFLPSSQPRVQRVAQGVAQEVNGEHHHRDGDARENRQPPGDADFLGATG